MFCFWLPRVAPSVCALSLVSCSLASEGPLHHIGSQGYSLSCPVGWIARQDPASGLVTIAGQGGSLTVWPLFLPSTRLDSRSALTTDRSLAAKVWPGAVWSHTEEVSAHSVRLVGNQNGHQRIAALAWIPSEKGAACYWYGADFGSSGSKLGPVFAEILASFNVTGKPAEQHSPSLSYKEYAEEGEHAFSFEAPSGWNVKSAVARSNPYDDRPVVVASAPDESVIVRLNDARVPGCILPSPMLNMVGGEGHLYNSGGGVNLLILHFMRPEEALNSYLSRILSQNVQGIQVTGFKPRPDLTQMLQSSFYSNVSVGDITFKCQRNGKAYSGALECCTGILAGSTIWGVGYLAGFLAEPGKEAEGLEVVTKLIKSFRTNPEWRMRENSRVGGLSKSMSAMFDHNRESIMNSWETKEKTEARTGERWEEANLGQEEVMDPETGNKLKIWSGSDYNWIDQHGRVVGTDSDSKPQGGDFHRLMTLP